MMARRIALAGLVAAAAVVVYLLVSSGTSPYEVRMSLADADGLRQGAPVAIAGQDVGNVSLTVVGGRVVATLKLNAKDGPVGRNAVASIDSVNLLGQKRVDLDKGTVSDAAPNGYMLPASQVDISTDLDQVLDVLTPNVRARLGILIDEAGIAMAGRRADISQVLTQLPNDLGAVRQLVSAVADNNGTLGDLVSTTNGFVSQLASQNTALERTIAVAGQSAATVASRRADLEATLANAPATLTSLDGFLAKLQQATVPLGPAARDITATAPKLQDTLDQVMPFTQAANPALRQATIDAPELTSLARGATPILTRATPVLGQLATFSSDLQPISDILDKSSDNLWAILQNWARAIQLRDGLSHVFRGEASISPQTFASLVDTLMANPVSGSPLASLQAQIRTGRRSNRATRARSGSSGAAGLSGLTSGIQHALSGASGAGSSAPAPAGAGGTATNGSTTSSTSSTTAPSPAGSLNSLLQYLLK